MVSPSVVRQCPSYIRGATGDSPRTSLIPYLYQWHGRLFETFTVETVRWLQLHGNKNTWWLSNAPWRPRCCTGVGKYNGSSITRKTSPIQHTYTMIDHRLTFVTEAYYLGVKIQEDLRLNKHIQMMISKSVRYWGCYGGTSWRPLWKLSSLFTSHLWALGLSMQPLSGTPGWDPTIKYQIDDIEMQTRFQVCAKWLQKNQLCDQHAEAIELVIASESVITTMPDNVVQYQHRTGYH